MGKLIGGDAKAGKAISSDNEFAKGNGGAPNQLSDKERFLKTTLLLSYLNDKSLIFKASI